MCKIPDDIQCPCCSASPSIPPRFTIAIATTRKQYKVLAANKCSATFYDRRCSFYCHTKSRFIERILFFPLLPSPVPSPNPSYNVEFYLRVETRRNRRPLGHREEGTSRSPAVEPRPSVLSRVSVMRDVIPFIAAISKSSSRIAFRFTLATITSSRFPLQSHSPSFPSYVYRSMECKKRKKERKKGCFTRRTLGWLHSKLMRMIVKPYRPTSSKHNRKFSPITYSPRSNRFFLRFIPSIFPFVIGVGQLHLSPWQTWSFRDGSL